MSLSRPFPTAALVLWLAGAASAQDAAPDLSAAEMEAFLLDAELSDFRSAGAGVTGSQRATASDGRLTHDVHIQTVDVSRSRFVARGARVELNFRDSYRYNIAAYRLAALLGLDNVPMSVPRRVDGESAAVTWWVDDVAMTEKERLDQRTLGPDPAKTTRQFYAHYVFDELIQNRDRNGASRRALTLAFILALTKVSEAEAPNVIDTPLGMTSGFVKRSILRTAVRESAQLILFLTHDEIAGCEEIIDDAAAVVFTLTNPAHYPKMLVNDPGVEERMVLRCDCDHKNECQICQRYADAQDE